MELIMRPLALFAQGGSVMYLILFCSFLTVALGIERWIYYRMFRPLPESFLKQLTGLLKRGQLEEAALFCRDTGNSAAIAAAAGISHIAEKGVRLETVLENEASLTAAKMNHNLNHLESIVTVAPLLGLLGTVMGMIDSFHVLDLQSGQPLAITGGIGEALVATAFGLCTAILAMAVHSYFSHQSDKRITEMESVFTVLIREIR